MRRIYANSIEFKENCFDIIRLMAAVTIILGHCRHYLDFPLDALGMLPNFYIGLYSMFAIAGFLIPASIERSSDALSFLGSDFCAFTLSYGSS